MTFRKSRISAHDLRDDGVVPNNSRFPALVYIGAVELPVNDPAGAFEQLFEKHRWSGSWRNGVFAFDHYHIEAHEVLGVYRGRAELCLGGANGVRQTVSTGDVVVIPAGVGHRKLESTRDFAVVGAYPRGQSSVIGRGEAAELGTHRARISATGMPEQDPVFGANGPLFEYWS